MGTVGQNSVSDSFAKNNKQKKDIWINRVFPDRIFLHRILVIINALVSEKDFPLYNRLLPVDKLIATNALANVVKNNEALLTLLKDNDDASVLRIVNNALNAMAIVFKEHWETHLASIFGFMALMEIFDALIEVAVEEGTFQVAFFEKYFKRINENRIANFCKTNYTNGIFDFNALGKILVEDMSDKE